MTFLAPIPAIIAACVCVPALVAMYLLKLQRREMLVSSTRLWTASQRDTQGNVPLRLLKPSLVFLLQLLAMVMLLLALARPVLNKSRADRERTMIVVDSSASMGARDMGVERSRFDVAIDRAKSIASAAALTAENGDVLLVDFAHRSRLIVPTGLGRTAINEAVQSIVQSDQSANVDALVELLSGVVRAQAQRQSVESENGDDRSQRPPETALAPIPTHIILLTDGGNFGADRDATRSGEVAAARIPIAGLASWPSVRISYDSIVPDGAIDRVGTTQDRNIGVTNISARRDAKDAALTRVLAQFHATTLAGERKDVLFVPIEVQLDGTTIETRSVGIADGSMAQETFDVRAPRGGVLTVRLMTDDALQADNEASVVLQPSRPPSLLFVVPDSDLTENNGVRGAAWLVGDVLAEVPQRRLDIISQSEWQNFEQSGADPIADMIVFDRVAPARVPRVPTISFGADILAHASDAQKEPQPTTILVWERRHPLLRDVSLDSVSGLLVPFDSEIDGMRTTVLAQGVLGPIIVLHEHEGVRHCVVGVELATSAWPMDFGFAVFLATAVESLTGTDPSRASISFTTADDAWTVRTTDGDGRDATEIALQRRLGTQIFESAPVRVTRTEMVGPNRQAAHVGNLARTGVYHLGTENEQSGSSDDRWQPIAVNLVSAAETLMPTLSELDLGDNVAIKGARANVERELWPWCLIAALGLMMLEWFASLNYPSRQRAG